MEVMFSKLEIACLHDFACHYKSPLSKGLISAIWTMAFLTGYQNSKQNPPPRYQKNWEGYIRLTVMTQAAEVLLGRADKGQMSKSLHPNKIPI